VLSQNTIAQYFSYALSTVWSQNKQEIVAITPFLLRSNGAFDKFSFIKNGQDTEYFKALANFPKEKGQPEVNIHTILTKDHQILGAQTLNTISQDQNKNNVSPIVQSVLKILFGM